MSTDFLLETGTSFQHTLSNLTLRSILIEVLVSHLYREDLRCIWIKCLSSIKWCVNCRAGIQIHLYLSYCCALNVMVSVCVSACVFVCVIYVYIFMSTQIHIAIAPMGSLRFQIGRRCLGGEDSFLWGDGIDGHSAACHISVFGGWRITE